MTVETFVLVGLLLISPGYSLVDAANPEKLTKEHSLSDTPRSRGVDVPLAGSCSGERLQRRISAATESNPVVVEPKAHDLCGETITLPSGALVRGKQGAKLINGKIRIAGTASEKANLARTLQRGSQQIEIELSSDIGLHPGDWIIVAESSRLNDNRKPDKGVPQELVQVASLDSTEKVITVGLRQPLHHPYELSGTDNESAVYKASPVSGSGLRDLALEGVDIELGIAQDITLINLELDRAHITPATSPLAALADAQFQNIALYHQGGQQSWNVLMQLDGCSRCVLEQIQTVGGKKDAIRLNGVADIALREIRIQQAPVRSLRIYRGDNVRIDRLTIVEGGYYGGQPANIEQWLLDYTHGVDARNVKILRFFQQDAVELRGDCADVDIQDLLVVEHSTPVNGENTCMNVHGGNFTVRNVSLSGFHFDGCSQQLRLAEGMSNVQIMNGSFINARSVSVDGGRHLVHDMDNVTFRNLEIAREHASFLIRNRNQTRHDIRSIVIDSVHVYGGSKRHGSLLNISDVQGLEIVNSYFEPVGNRRILVRGRTKRVRYLNNIDRGVHAVVIQGGVDVESKARRVVRN